MLHVPAWPEEHDERGDNAIGQQHPEENDVEVHTVERKRTQPS